MNETPSRLQTARLQTADDRRTQTLRVLWGIVAIIGGLAILGSLLALLLTFLVPALRADAFGVVIASSSIVGLLLSSGLVWAGVSGWSGVVSPRIYSHWAWLIFLLLAGVLIIVAVWIPAEHQLSPWFAPFHAGLIIFPALAILSLVVLMTGQPMILTWRQSFLAITGGISTVILALPVELIGFLISGVVVIVLAFFFPGGEAEVNRITAFVEPYLNMPMSTMEISPGTQIPLDMEEYMSILSSPVVLGILALTLGVVTPVIEELGKALVIGVMGYWSRPSPLQGFIWGVAAGIGFAIIEGVSNGAMGLGDTLGWLSGVGTRGMATAMHALTTGLVGLGWGLFYHRKRWALPLAYSAAVIFHGLWNFNIIATLGSTSLSIDAPSIGTFVTFMTIGVQGVLVLLAPLSLLGIPLLLRKRKNSTG
ncbi:MAG: PrsW family intramembrane metalloprotease [Anaerolineae bacterium]|nr:PrsW family intramembrane metalloprotease [Anaerolineae bacterium]